jgi:histidine triad (HIT) family protein
MTASTGRGRWSDGVGSADCPFCGCIQRGEYDYDDQWSVAFQSRNPVTPGHFLVVPRKHTASAFTSPIATGRAMRFAAELAQWMSLGDFNLITSAGSHATQTVFHLHVHVVPRRDGDGLHLPWTGQVQARD